MHVHVQVHVYAHANYMQNPYSVPIIPGMMQHVYVHAYKHVHAHYEGLSSQTLIPNVNLLGNHPSAHSG